MKRPILKKIQPNKFFNRPKSKWQTGLNRFFFTLSSWLCWRFSTKRTLLIRIKTFYSNTFSPSSETKAVNRTMQLRERVACKHWHTDITTNKSTVNWAVTLCQAEWWPSDSGCFVCNCWDKMWIVWAFFLCPNLINFYSAMTGWSFSTDKSKQRWGFQCRSVSSWNKTINVLSSPRLK